MIHKLEILDNPVVAYNLYFERLENIIAFHITMMNSCMRKGGKKVRPAIT